MKSDDARLRVAVVGAGRLGTALTQALNHTESIDVAGPFGRGFTGATYDVVLLCVPDREIPPAAAAVEPGPLVGHCSGATSPTVLDPHEGFVLHPLMTVRGDGGDELAGAACTVAGTTPHALTTARTLADALGMPAVTVADADRGAYHAAASFAANFAITVQACAARLLAGTGVPSEFLAPLARAALDNCATHGSRAALTGPVVRGDEETVAAQRQAVGDRAPELLPLFDALVEQTRRLTGRTEEVAA
ncbi:MAG: DUF2520 domain-containing protein [Streptosporangiales bacterium]|nr:DUF2520 domain-containing protein [Streptosporangiales bacterium]